MNHRKRWAQKCSSSARAATVVWLTGYLYKCWHHQASFTIDNDTEREKERATSVGECKNNPFTTGGKKEEIFDQPCFVCCHGPNSYSQAKMASMQEMPKYIYLYKLTSIRCFLSRKRKKENSYPSRQTAVDKEWCSMSPVAQLITRRSIKSLTTSKKTRGRYRKREEKQPKGR